MNAKFVRKPTFVWVDPVSPQPQIIHVDGLIPRNVVMAVELTSELEKLPLGQLVKIYPYPPREVKK